jgi:hypothetical protein
MYTLVEASNEERAAITVADKRRAWSEIYTTIDPTVQGSLSPEVRNGLTADPQALYDEVLAKYGNATWQKAASLMASIWREPCGDDVFAYFSRCRSAYQEIVTGGKELDQEWVGIAILQGLPPSYQPISQQLCTRQEFSLDDVFNAIAAEHERQQQSSTSSALAAHLAPSKPSSSKNSGASNCRSVNGSEKKCQFHPNSNTHDTADCRRALEQKLDQYKQRFGDLDSHAQVVHSQSCDTDTNVGVVRTSSDFDPLALMVSLTVADPSFVIDSGATEHVVTSKDLLSDLRTSSRNVAIGNNTRLAVTHTGTLALGHRRMRDALLVPEMHYNLLSVRRLALDGFTTAFTPTECTVSDGSGIFVKAQFANGLYTFKVRTP